MCYVGVCMLRVVLFRHIRISIFPATDTAPVRPPSQSFTINTQYARPQPQTQNSTEPMPLPLINNQSKPDAPCYHRQIPHGSLPSSHMSIMEKQHLPTTSSNPMASSVNAWLGRYGISTAIQKSSDEELQ